MNENDFNNEALRRTAVTFATEALSKETKLLLSKKIEYNSSVLKYISEIIKAVVSSNDKNFRRELSNKNSTISKLMNSALIDFQDNCILLNHTLKELLKKQDFIDSKYLNTDNKGA